MGVCLSVCVRDFDEDDETGENTRLLKKTQKLQEQERLRIQKGKALQQEAIRNIVDEINNEYFEVVSWVEKKNSSEAINKVIGTDDKEILGLRQNILILMNQQLNAQLNAQMNSQMIPSGKGANSPKLDNNNGNNVSNYNSANY